MAVGITRPGMTGSISIDAAPTQPPTPTEQTDGGDAALDALKEQLNAISVFEIMGRFDGTEQGDDYKFKAIWRGADDCTVRLCAQTNTWHDFGDVPDDMKGGDAISLYGFLSKPDYDPKRDLLDVCMKMAEAFKVPIPDDLIGRFGGHEQPTPQPTAKTPTDGKGAPPLGWGDALPDYEAPEKAVSKSGSKWNQQSDLCKLEAFYACVPSSLAYGDWLAVAWIARKVGGCFDDFLEWSRDSDKFKDEEDCRKKWNDYKEGKAKGDIGTLVNIAEKHGMKTMLLAYFDNDNRKGATTTAQTKKAASPHATPIPESFTVPGGDWKPYDDFLQWLAALFQTGDKIAICVTSKDNRPIGKGNAQPFEHWLKAAARYGKSDNCSGDLAFMTGDWNKDAGAWARVNPMDGAGGGDANVTAFRHTLIESDDLPIDEQLKKIRDLNLPCAAIVHSGGKSIHAVVKIQARDKGEYEKRVGFLKCVCEDAGFTIDEACLNPSRYSRLPGATRGGNKQFLIAVNCGAATWDEWARARDAEADDGGEVEPVETLHDFMERVSKQPDNSLIGKGFLRPGGIVMLCAESGIGKSTLTAQMICHWAAGIDCFGFWPTRPLRILYIQNENDDQDLSENFGDIKKGMESEGKAFYDVKFAIWPLSTKSGDGFVNALEAELSKMKGAGNLPDMVVIDNLLSYCGCDLSKQSDTSHLMRDGLNRVLKRFKVGLWIIHHENKPTKEPLEGRKADKYAGSGSSDITNLARGIVRLVCDHDGIFKIVVPKRWRQLNYPEQGRFIEYDKNGLIYWREVSAWDVPIPPEKPKKVKFTLDEKAQMLLKALEPDTSYTRPELIEILKVNEIESSNNKQGAIIKILEEKKKLRCELDKRKFIYFLIDE